MKIYIRADSSASIGSGHIIRCRNLARYLEKFGVDIYFICREFENNMSENLLEEFQVIKLPIRKKQIKSLDKNQLYLNWLGCNEEQDASDTYKALINKEIGIPNYFLIDSYSIGINWQKKLIKEYKKEIKNIEFLNSLKFIFIDDLANREFQADILINQNFFGFDENNLYEYLSLKPKLQLIGPQYSILGEEYIQDNSDKVNPKQNNRYKKILVFFGSTDKNGINIKILNILLDLNLDDYLIDFVLPKINKDNQRIIYLLRNKKNFKIYQDLPSLEKLIKDADFSIGAGGTTTLERLLYCLDSFVISTAENQVEICKKLHKERFINYLGDIENLNIDKIKKTLISHLECKIKFQNPKFIIDKFGLPRIASAILGLEENLFLRKASQKDIYILWMWKNDIDVRKNSFNSSFIPIEDHKKWFELIMSKKECVIQYIIQNENKIPIGQVRFDIDKKTKEIEIDISIDRSFRGRKLSRIILKMAIQNLQDELENDFNITAKVLKYNLSSSNLFKSLGFVITQKDPYFVYEKKLISY